MPQNLPLTDPVFEKDVVILSGHGAFPVDSNTLVRKEDYCPSKIHRDGMDVAPWDWRT